MFGILANVVHACFHKVCIVHILGTALNIGRGVLVAVSEGIKFVKSLIPKVVDIVKEKSVEVLLRIMDLQLTGGNGSLLFDIVNKYHKKNHIILNKEQLLTYEYSERRIGEAEEKELLFSGMGVAGGEDGGRFGDMQLILDAYNLLKNAGRLMNPELGVITADTFELKDDRDSGELVDKILPKTMMKQTGKWTVQQAADLSIAALTIAVLLDSKILSGLKDQRVVASQILSAEGLKEEISGDVVVGKGRMIDDVRMNLLRSKSSEKRWNLDLGEIARIRKGGCFINSVFLDNVKLAYQRNLALSNLPVDLEFESEMVRRQAARRRVVRSAFQKGIVVPRMSASFRYFDTYDRARLPSNLVHRGFTLGCIPMRGLTAPEHSTLSVWSKRTKR